MLFLCIILFMLTITDADFQELGMRTEGFSGSDVNVVVKDVLMQPIRMLREATHFRKVRDEKGGTLSRDMLMAQLVELENCLAILS
jgi:hypothetical protein